MSSSKVEVKFKQEIAISLGVNVVTHESCDYSFKENYLMIHEKVGESILITPHNLSIVSQIKITEIKKS